MTFPTTPTVAAGRVLSNNQLDTTGTRTGPSLTSLTFDVGDLLVFICGVYQSSAAAGAVFSGWAGGGLTWTEIVDGGGTTSNNSVGVAIARSITGSETGTVSVTQAATITGDASMILLAIPGAHASSNPEATAVAVATGAAADPASLSPSWGAEDTLWIWSLTNGCTNATGTWTATGSSATTNFTDRVDTNATDTSTIGDCEAAVAFRQLNASSLNVGVQDADTTNARNAALVIAVRPAVAQSNSQPRRGPRRAVMSLPTGLQYSR